MNYKPEVGSYVVLSTQGIDCGLHPGANILGLVVNHTAEGFYDCVTVRWPHTEDRPYHIHYLELVGEVTTRERIAHKARTQELVL